MQLAQPSSFDTFNAFSFGSILWMIDYCLKIVQKVNMTRFNLMIKIFWFEFWFNKRMKLAAVDKLMVSNNRCPQLQKRIPKLQQTKTRLPKRMSTLFPKMSIWRPSLHQGDNRFKTFSIFCRNKIWIKIFIQRQIITGVLEKFLNFLLGQIILFERQSQFAPRDKKIFKRELFSEIVSQIIVTIIELLFKFCQQISRTQYCKVLTSRLREQHPRNMCPNHQSNQVPH